MATSGNIDPCLRTLGGVGRYQLLQALAVTLGSLGASYQLMGNIFIGRQFKTYECSRPNNVTDTSEWPDDIMWNTSDVKYGQCEIVVSSDNSSEDYRVYPCLFGHTYDFDKHLSFRTEFDLVCEHKLLGGLIQTLVIMGQGIGAVIASILSDRYGRKPVLVASQLGLMILGLGAGFVPSYAGLAALKFIIGAVQQGVITSKATLTIECFPAEYRSLQTLLGSTVWAACMMSMSLVAFLMREHNWRYLQIALSAASGPVVLFQLWYVDESLRWLMANDRKKAAVNVLQRAARVNRKDLKTVLNSLSLFSSHSQQEFQALTKGEVDETKTTSSAMTSENDAGEGEPQKLSVLDLFRHRRLLFNASIMWTAWFTCAFSFFGLYMMSASLHGNRFLNYFLTAVMELIPGFVFYFMVDRIGRKWATKPLFALAGLGLVTSGVFRIFTDEPVLKTMSVVMAMLGMVGASGMFGAVFFLTPELFPTNVRNQALGVSSFTGRLGGMLSPFMVDLSEIAVWAPGALIGSLCFLVVALVHFLPETKGRELPNTVQDIKQWYKHHSSSSSTTPQPWSQDHHHQQQQQQQQQQQAATDLSNGIADRDECHKTKH